MRSKLIIIRGPPASGKSTLARSLVKKLKGKKALLIADEFRWVMTAQDKRDEKDYKIAFDNFLFALRNYLKAGYTVVAEDCWVKKHKDKVTDVNKVVRAGKNSKIVHILLKGSWDKITYINTLRPMRVPEKELCEIYEAVYSKEIEKERIVDIDGKNPEQVLKEVLKRI